MRGTEWTLNGRGVRARRAAVLVASLVVVSAGCTGTDDDSAAPTPTTTTVPEPTTQPSATPEATELPAAQAAQGDAAALERVIAAQEATMNADTARFVMEQQFEGVGEEQQVATSAEGAIDFATSEIEMTMDNSMITGQQGGGMIEMLIAGETVYMQMPDMGGQWISVPSDSEALGSGFDPTRSFNDVADSIKSAVEAGEEEIRGVSTTRYDVIVDLDLQLANANDDARRTEIQQQIDLFGSTELPTSMWIDEDNLIRRQQNDLVLSDPAMGEVTIAQNIEFFDYGVDLDFEIPTNVLDISDLASEFPTEAP